MKKKSSDSTTPEQIKTLIDTALGKVKADMVIASADLVNVYSGELLKKYSVAVKGEKIAFVGEDAGHTIGPDTRVIDAAGKTLIPGLIDGHNHIFFYFTVDEFLKYAMKGGTTAIFTETTAAAFPLGPKGVKLFANAISDQPIKIFATVPAMMTHSPAAKPAAIRPEQLRGVLKHKGVIGLGETYWTNILEGDERILGLFAETLNAGKTIEGHSAGARNNKLAAFTASGIAACHESTTAEEVLERVRLGIHTMVREGDVRRDLDAIITGIKDEPIDFRRVSFCTDGLGPKRLMELGYMEHLLQRAIDLGFDPITAIQMATLNNAERFSIDNLIGGIAPGKYADMVIIPDLRTIKAEMVISSGQVIAEKGEILVPPKKYAYPRSVMRSVHLPRKLKPDDFHVRVEGGDKPVTVRVINQVTDVLTREEQVTMIPENGLLKADLERDILKVAVIERTSAPGKMFTGFIKGINIKKGAFATSGIWEVSGILVVGTNDKDIAGAVNRVRALQGGVLVYADGKVQKEMPLNIAGSISELPVETIYQRFQEIQQKMLELGTHLHDAHMTIANLATGAIPFLRICESGYIDIRGERVVGLMVS